MKPECIDALTRAAGRPLTKSEVDGIEERMLSSMRELARKDPEAWRAMSATDRYMKAAELARSRHVEDVLHAQQRTIRNAQLQAERIQQVDSFKPGLKGQLAALRQRLSFHNNFTGGDVSLDQKVKGIYRDFTRELDAAGLKGKFWGLIQDPEKQGMLMHAIFGDRVSDPGIAEAGKMIRQVLERARQTAEDAGIKIHHLDNWHVPQPWAWERIATDPERFIRDMMGEIDASSYVNLDGSPMNAKEIENVVRAAAETLATEGANKRGQAMSSGFGAGVGAKRNAPRQLHFKDADAYMRMMDKYGTANNVYSLLSHHLNGMARDIGLAREYGTNGDRLVMQLIDRAYAADVRSGNYSERQLKHLERLKRQTIREFQGLTAPQAPGSIPLWATISNVTRSIVGSTMLGTSTISAIPDMGMALAYGREIGLSKRALLANMAEGAKMSKANRDYLRRLGIAVDTMHYGTARFGAGELSNQFTRFLSHGVHVASLLRMWDRAQMHGISASLMDILGAHVTGKAFGELSDAEKAYFKSRGVTPDIYETWRNAELDAGPHGNHTMLTPDGVYAIPDEKLRPIAERRVAAESAHFREAAQKLKERNAAEVEWVGNRVQKLAELRDKARSTVAQLRAKGAVREGLAKNEADALAEVLDAKVSLAEITLKLDRTLAAEKSSDRIRGIMADVLRMERTPTKTMEGGNVGAVFESGKPDNAAKAALNSGMRLGEQLGLTRARALRRLRDAEARVTEARREGKTRADKAAQKFATQIDQRTTALDKFIEASQQRRERRSEWLNEYEKAGGNVVEQDIRRLRSEAAQHLLAVTLSETHIGARGASGNTVAESLKFGITPENEGTFAGQALRWLLFLKQTPLGIFRTHMLDVPRSLSGWRSVWWYRARFMAMSASLGALSLTIKSILRGQDPDDLTQPKNLAKVLIASGGLGMYGDFLIGGDPEHQDNAFVKLMGPGATALSDAYQLYLSTQKKAADDAAGKGHYGAQLLRFARNYAMPFTRLWYLRAAFDHMVYQQQMDKLAPGYNARVRSRMAKEHEGSWWAPGTMEPQRAPDLGKVAGQ